MRAAAQGVPDAVGYQGYALYGVIHGERQGQRRAGRSSAGARGAWASGLGRLAHLDLKLHQALHHVGVDLGLVALGLLLVEGGDQVLEGRVLGRLAVFGGGGRGGRGLLGVGAGVAVVVRGRVGDGGDGGVCGGAGVHGVHGVPRRVAWIFEPRRSGSDGDGSEGGGSGGGVGVGVGLVGVGLVAAVADGLLDEVVGELGGVDVVPPVGVERHGLGSLTLALRVGAGPPHG